MQGAPGRGPLGRVLGTAPSAELLAFCAVYFVEGVTKLSRVAVRFFAKDDLEVDPAFLDLLGSLHLIPWICKPVYGVVSDAVPLFGSHRRSYLVLCAAAAAAAWALLGLAPASRGLTAACILAEGLAGAFADVVVNSLVIVRARGAPPGELGTLQSLCWAAKATGVLLASYGSNWAVGACGPRAVFLATALFPLMAAAFSFAIPEDGDPPRPAPRGAAAGGGGGGGGGGDEEASDAAPLLPAGGAAAPGSGGAGLRGILRVLGTALRDRRVALPAIFLFLWNSSPSPASAMFYFYTGKLGFSPAFMGRAELAGAIANLAGIAVYGRYLREAAFRPLFMWVGAASTLLHASQVVLVEGWNRAAGVPDGAFLLGDRAALAAVYELGHMPLRVMAARVCPVGVEATLFACLMAVANLAHLVSEAGAGLLTRAFGVTKSDMGALSALVITCAVIHAVPVLFIPCLVPKDIDPRVPGAVLEKEDAGAEDGSGWPGGGGVAAPGAGGPSSTALEMSDQKVIRRHMGGSMPQENPAVLV